MIGKTVLLFLILFQFLLAQQEEYKIEHITMQQGFAYDCISYILEDSKGFIWIATEDGLNRYDGYCLKEYKPDPKNPFSINSNFIRTLFEDPADSGKVLWIGTRGGGLNKFDMETERFYHYRHNPDDPLSLSHDNVKCIYKEKEDLYWIGTEGGGLNRFDRTRGTFVSYKNDVNDPYSLTNNGILSICGDRQGNLWIATLAGLNKLEAKEIINLTKNEISDNSIIDKTKFIHYLSDNKNQYSLPSNAVHAVYEDRQGMLWVGTYEGLRKYEHESDRFIRHEFESGYLDILNNSTIWHIYEDDTQALWIATLGDGVIKINKPRSRFTIFQGNINNIDNINSNLVSSVYVDGSGVAWIGTYCNGMNKLLPLSKKFKHYFHRPEDPKSLRHNQVVTFFEDANNTLWVGTNGGGLHKFNNKMQEFVPYDFGSNKSLPAISGSASGDLWIARYVSLTKFDPETEKYNNYYCKYLSDPQDDVGNLIYVHVDVSGIPWCIITVSSPISGGLYQFDRAREEFIPYEIYTDELVSDNISVVYQDRSETLWFGTFNKGLVKRVVSGYEKYEFIQYKNDAADPHSISNNNINSIYESESGYLWIGTDWGLNQFNPETEEFISYSKKDGLPSDKILAVLEDNSGNIWCSTDKGLSKFSLENQKFMNYDVLDGLQSLSFNHRAAYKSSNGELFFGGRNGFNAFYPDSIIGNLHIPTVVITDFQLHNRSVLPGENSPLKRSILQTKKIQLTHDQNVISFEFSALDYNNPERNQYAYKMEGVNRDWVYTDASRRYASYTKLDPGEYIFKVKGSNNDGVWNERATTITIVILPPWWRTNWAYGVYFILLCALLYLLRRYDLRRQRLKHELQLEHIKAEKYQEIEQMKSRFFANISHEFRTPLTLILGPTKKLLSREFDEDSRNTLRIMQRNANRLLRLINQLLDFSKLEAGKMKLQASAGDIIVFIKGIMMSFQTVAERKEIKYSFSAQNKQIELYFDRDKMEKILYNLLSNAFKFTPTGGEIGVSVTPLPSASPLMNKGGIKGGSEGYIKITISNSGPGIPPDRIEKIFDRFYHVSAIQDSPTAHGEEQESTGIGLALSKELVELHHGTIDVHCDRDALPCVSGLSDVSTDMARHVPTDSLTTFTVQLPLGRDHLSDDEIVEEEVSLSKPEVSVMEEDNIEPGAVRTIEPKAYAAGKNIILIVEDNRDMRLYVREYLHKQYEIREAVDGSEGVEMAREIIPDLIISDIMMPKMSGYDLCRTLKEDELTSHIPIILLTAKAEREDKLEGLGVGADDYLVKPFDSLELIVRVKNLIEIRQKLQKRLQEKGFTIEARHREALLNPVDKRFLERIDNIVAENMSDEKFDVKRFGKMVGMSGTQLRRKMSALTGQSPGHFIRYLRLQEAARLIRDEKQTVSEAAYLAGFNSLSYFSKCFKQQFGVLPSQY